MHIISTDEKQVFAAVQEWNQNNTYSLYISDSPGVYFTLSLENLRTSRGLAGNLLVDFYKVRSLSPSWPAAVTAPLIPLPGVSHNSSRSCQKWLSEPEVVIFKLLLCLTNGVKTFILE